jgi:hypothetical protein
MRSLFRLFIFTAFSVFATLAVADNSSCKDCGSQGQDSSSSHREQLKADRAKYDRENDKIVARPWDVIKNDTSLPEPKR